jgi:tetratricopeptide (TPR) repeat protein
MKRTPGPPALPGLFPARPGPSTSPVFNAAAFNPAALFQDAARAHDAGRLDEAERVYRLALKLAPRDAASLARLGALLSQSARWEEGAALLEQSVAIDPRQPHVLTNLGNALIELDRPDEAVAAYERAIALLPAADRAAAFVGMGAYLQGVGRAAHAVGAYDMAIRLKPKMPEAWANRGASLIALNRLDDAIASLDRAVALKPDLADALTNRGIARYRSLRAEEALADFDRALALKPDGAEIHNNKGLALQALGRFEDALASADQAIALRPDMAETANNRGKPLQELDRWDEAAAAYDQAIALKPDYAEPHWNKGIILVRGEDYANGWPLLEWRWRNSDSPPPPRFDQPLWLGEPSLAGKTILVHAEQGLGDTISMLRFVPLLAARGAKVLLCVPKALHGLAASVDGAAEVLGPELPAGGFDFHCPTMSLPLALGTRIDTIPADVPYLSAPLAKVEAWKARLGPRTRRRIGLTWSGNPDQKDDRSRSIALGELLPLLGIDADFHSLQKAYRPADAKLLRDDGRIRDHADDLEDFTDTAALAGQMDLVISVCTSVAHMAGALGLPTYVLLAKSADYRWHWDRADSPWYPTARLFRQTRAGDWEAVIAQVGRALG